MSLERAALMVAWASLLAFALAWLAQPAHENPTSLAPRGTPAASTCATACGCDHLDLTSACCCARPLSKPRVGERPLAAVLGATTAQPGSMRLVSRECGGQERRPGARGLARIVLAPPPPWMTVLEPERVPFGEGPEPGPRFDLREEPGVPPPRAVARA